MTQVAQVLAEVDDPSTIQDILEATANIDESTEAAVDTPEPPIDDLYNRFLSRRENRSPSTQAQYKRTIPEFIQYAQESGVSAPSAITHELVDSFVDQLEAQYQTDATVLTYTKNVRTWLVWLSDREYVDETIFRLLNKDKLGLSPEARDEAISAAKAEYILSELRSKRFGSAIHALKELLWNGGPRLGGARSLDVQDFDPSNSELRFRHRPETGTRLKNGCEDDQTPGDGERNVTISDDVIAALKHYIKYERPEVTDEYGREPLFATPYGRATRSTLRRWVYEATSCSWANEEASQHTCDGTCDPDSNVCPHSYYPHAIRRGAIVHHLSNGLRPDRASERFDVSTAIIKKHYDPRSKHERKEDRAEAVRNAW